MTKAKTAKKTKSLTLFEAARNVFAFLSSDEKEKIVKEFTPKPLKEEKAKAQKPKKAKAPAKKLAKKKKPAKTSSGPRKMTRANGGSSSSSAAA